MALGKLYTTINLGLTSQSGAYCPSAFCPDALANPLGLPSAFV